MEHGYAFPCNDNLTFKNNFTHTNTVEINTAEK